MDRLQLPPVKEFISPVFKLKNVSTLNQVVRQACTNPNTHIISLIRNDIVNNSETLIPYLNANGSQVLKGEGFRLAGRDTFYVKLLELYQKTDIQSNTSALKTLAWTNATVTGINKAIRNKLHPNADFIDIGDMLTGYKTVMQKQGRGQDGVLVVKNSVDYIVTQVDYINQIIDNVSIKMVRVRTKESDYSMPIIHPDSYIDFAKICDKRLDDAKWTRRWKLWYEFKEQYVLKDDLFSERGTLLATKDIDYGYALTVHKSQGSTYEKVAVILPDIMQNRTPIERKKLLYVALSRTSQMNYILM